MAILRRARVRGCQSPALGPSLTLKGSRELSMWATRGIGPPSFGFKPAVNGAALQPPVPWREAREAREASEGRQGKGRVRRKGLSLQPMMP